jgi:hypothetical protein
MSATRRTPQQEQAFRVLRSIVVMLVFTFGSVASTRGVFFPPHGNPLIYSFAVSWQIAFVMAILSSAAFSNVDPARFSLALWERQGEAYDRAGIQAFRWVLLHSPLGWINANFHLRTTRGDCARALRELNAAEGVHWLTCAVSVLLALFWLFRGYAVYGYVMLLVRIPFDLYPIMLQRWNRGRLSRVLERAANATSRAG